MTRLSRPRSVILITGPPCAGKSTLAHDLALSGDIVVDFDHIAQELGSPAQWLHPEPYASRAEQLMREICSQLPGMDPGTAYVIRSAPKGRGRVIAAKAMHADMCLLVDPGMSTCLERASSRPEGTVDEVSRWYRTFTPWSGDTIVSET